MRTTLDHPACTVPPPASPERRPGASAFTRTALAAMGAVPVPASRTLDGRWGPVHDALELVVEVAAAAQLYAIHRRVAIETGLSGVETSRERVRLACEDVVRHLLAAHAVLAVTEEEPLAEVALAADRHEGRWAFDADEGISLLPTMLLQELSDALRLRGTDGDPGPVLVEAAGAALALWLLTGAQHEPLRHRAF